MAVLSFETLDVFADKVFSGNPLAVITDAQGLSTEEMQAITCEFNLSETTFILPPEDQANTAKVRIFTPGYEMPFAGHPTVGTAISIARIRNITGELALELNAGLFRVNVSRKDDHWFAEFLKPNLPAEIGAAPSANALEAALSLPDGVIDRGDFKPRLIGAGGVDFVYARAPLSAVRSACVNSAAFDALGIDTAVGVYLYAAGGETPDANYHARMFAPNAGIVEDPATGSAAASLPGHIVLSQSIADGEHRWLVEQGFEMGRPSLIRARVETIGGAVKSVRIGGNAAFVQRGEFTY